MTVSYTVDITQEDDDGDITAILRNVGEDPGELADIAYALRGLAERIESGIAVPVRTLQ